MDSLLHKWCDVQGRRHPVYVIDDNAASDSVTAVWYQRLGGMPLYYRIDRDRLTPQVEFGHHSIR